MTCWHIHSFIRAAAQRSSFSLAGRGGSGSCSLHPWPPTSCISTPTQVALPTGRTGRVVYLAFATAAEYIHTYIAMHIGEGAHFLGCELWAAEEASGGRCGLVQAACSAQGRPSISGWQAGRQAVSACGMVAWRHGGCCRRKLVVLPCAPPSSSSSFLLPWQASCG